MSYDENILLENNDLLNINKDKIFDKFIIYPNQIKNELLFGINKIPIDNVKIGSKYGIGYNKNLEIIYFKNKNKDEAENNESEFIVNKISLPSESKGIILDIFSTNFLGVQSNKKNSDALKEIYINQIGNLALVDTRLNILYFIILSELNDELKIEIVPVEKNKIYFTTFSFITNKPIENNLNKINCLFGTNEGLIYNLNLKFKNKKNYKEGFDIEIKKLHEFKFANDDKSINKIDLFTLNNDLKLIFIYIDSGLFYYSSKILSFKKIISNIDDKKYNKHLIIKNKLNEKHYYNICFDQEKNILYNIVYYDGKKLNYIKFDENFIDLENEEIKNYIIDKGKFDEIDTRLSSVYGKIKNIFSNRYHWFVLFEKKISIIDLLENEFKGEFSLKENFQIDYFGNFKNYLILNNGYNLYNLNIVNEKDNYWIKLVNKNYFKEAFEFCCENKLEVEKSQSGKIYLNKLLKGNNYDKALEVMKKTDISFDYIMYKLFNNNDTKDEKKTILILKYLIDKINNYSEAKNNNKEILLCFVFDICIYKINNLEKFINLKKEDTYLNINVRIDTKDLDDYKQIYLYILKNFSKFLNLDIINYIFTNYKSKEFVDFSMKLNQLEILLNYYLIYNDAFESIKILKLILSDINKLIDEKIGEDIINEKISKTIYYLKNFSIKLYKYKPFEYLDLINYLIESRIFKFLNNQQIKEIIYFSLNINKLEELSLIINILKSIKTKLIIKKQEKEIIITVGNYLIYLFSKFPITETLEKYLLEFENVPQEKFDFNINFALFLFKDNSKLIRSKIILYGLLKYYVNTVKLSLRYDYIDLAKFWASKPKDNYIKKRLWLQISLKFLNQNNNQYLIELLKEENCKIGIEDLIPYFDNESKIKDFQEEITNSLNFYNKDIKKLKSEMLVNSTNSNILREEINDLKNKYYLIDYSKQCDYCKKNIFNSTFYFFPCSHSFHKECSLKLIDELGGSQKLEQIKKMQDNLKRYKVNLKNKKLNNNNNNNKNIDLKKLLNKQEILDLENKEKDIDNFIGDECYFCGNIIIDWAFEPFNNDGLQLDLD